MSEPKHIDQIQHAVAVELDWQAFELRFRAGANSTRRQLPVVNFALIQAAGLVKAGPLSLGALSSAPSRARGIADWITQAARPNVAVRAVPNTEQLVAEWRLID